MSYAPRFENTDQLRFDNGLPRPRMNASEISIFLAMPGRLPKSRWLPELKPAL
jgi:hypothetical protein